MYIGLHVKYSLFLSILMKLEFFRQIFKKIPQISNFMKIHPVGAELFHADGRTDRHDKNVYSFFAILRTRLKLAKNHAMLSY